jgi:aryl-alcohol dehydrogenase-like predicted oxidoreductase
MKNRTLMHTDLEVSRLCMGTMTFGSQVDQGEAQRMTDYCLDQGIQFFDTANVYNQGASEEIVGRCLKSKRDKVILASKACNPMERPRAYSGLSRQAMHWALEDTLQRLQTDYLDLYYLHRPDYETPIEESLETLEDFRREGKIRYGAISNYSAWQHAEIFSLCEKNGWQAPHTAQQMYNVITRNLEQEYVPFAKRFEVSIVAYNPLAGGLLTGKQSAAAPIAGTRFDGNQQYLSRYWHGQYFDAVQELKGIAERHGRTLLETSLGWLLHQERVDSVILGASRFEHLKANVEAARSGPLPAEVMEASRDVWMKLRGPAPQYNR